MLDQNMEQYMLDMDQIEHLQWSQCGYTLVGGEITRLGFYEKPLKELSQEIFAIKTLEMLSLIHNQLTHIPPEIGNLSHLKELYLGGNSLTTLPDEMGHLKELKYLYVFEDDLKHLPHTLVKLNHLEEFIIQTKHEQEILKQIKSYPIQSKKIVLNDVEIKSDTM